MKTFYNVVEYLTGALFNILFVVIAAVIVYIVSSWAYVYGKDLFVENLNVPYEEYTIEIPEGKEPGKADAMEIGKILSDAGLAKNAWIFYVQARLNGTYNKFKPGTYIFNTQMGTGKIMDIMQQAQYAPVNDTLILIPEGLNLKQIGALCESKGLFTAAEFLAACNEYMVSGQAFFFLEPINRVDRLQGYLFPDTYYLPENAEPKDLIDRMLTRFQEVFTYELEARAEELGVTVDQAIIIASIIEKEVRVAEERPLCSAIIYNRLTKNMSLEMCSTVQYVLDKPRDRLFESDLAIDSPYNTYKYRGLPVGPICNPGKDAIVAALYPADADYLYMVLKDEESAAQSGEHFFTNNLAEHEAAKELYKQKY